MAEKKSFFERLALVQQELKAPKGQYNSFGKYKYRSCEDILEAVKPVAGKYGIFITVGDELIHEGDRFYIKATAKAVDTEGGGIYGESAYAREEDSKKGMDGSQITGTASSYARKYALNGLLCIDDTKDADTDENKKMQDADKSARGEALALMSKYSAEMVKKTCAYYGIKKLDDLTEAQAKDALSRIKVAKKCADEALK